MSDATEGTDGILPNQRSFLRASKWLQLFVLLDVDEMAQLLDQLAPLQIYLSGTVLKRGTGLLSTEGFLAAYRSYVSGLQEGRAIDEAIYRAAFSSLWTRTPDQLSVLAIGENEQMIRASNPVIQLRPHRFSYSTHDGKFRSMVLGEDSISWGIQFAYPQIIQDPKTQEIENVFDSHAFPNSDLFRALQRWIRHHTLPTPFIVDQKRTNVPIRLGHACFSWINQHPQLGLLRVENRIANKDQDSANGK